MTALPRQVLSVLGPWRSLDEVAKVIERAPGFTLDREASALSNDARMEAAFEASADRVTPSMSDEDLRAIREHAAVAYVLSPPIEAAEAMDIARETLALIVRLFEAGAAAVKSESAGIAHGRERWLELAREAAGDDPEDSAVAIYLAFVRRPLLDEPVYYTCGMHLLGERDVEVPTREKVLDAVDLLDTLAIYLLTEKPPDGVEQGHTFRRSEKDPLRELRAHPCARYPEDDFFFNAHGYLRIERFHRPKQR